MINLTKNAENLLNKGYLRNNEKTWQDIALRVANAISLAEKNESEQQYWSKTFYNAISNMLFVPSTPCLINAGTEQQQLSSCFILGLKDNIESIYNVKAEMAKIFQKNGGAGLNISVLRPKNSTVETSKGISCGILGFMEEFNLTADVVTRNNLRKGALKIDLSDFHPDIFDFIEAKDKTDVYNFMNISVALSNKFMNAVKNDLDWDLRFPDYSKCKEIYNEIWTGDIEDWEKCGHPVKIYQTIKARDLYKKIIEHAWKTGEPGVSFLDNMNICNPNPHLGKTNNTNPCGEFNSIPYNSCNLGSINLSKMIKGSKEVDWDLLYSTVQSAVRFLDDMITVNKLPLHKLEQVTKSIRSIGLGTMGLAEMLFELNLQYGSEECCEFIKKLYKFIKQVAFITSRELAVEKGVYPEWEKSIYSINANTPMRNSNLLSIAPNGSIGFICNVTGGLEPTFALVYSRKMNDGTIFYNINPVFEKELKKRNLYSDELIQKIADNNGSCQGVKEIPLEMQKIFVTASDISPETHLKVLAIIQNYVDLSCSKTINLPNTATVNDVYNIYINAWELGTKGVTIYRDGSRDGQTLSVKRVTTDNKDNKTEVTQLSKNEELKRGDLITPSDDLLAYKRTIRTGCGKLYLHADFDEFTGELLETFISLGSGGGCERNSHFISRLISYCLRLGGTVEGLIDQAMSIGACKAYTDRTKSIGDTSKGISCPSAIGFTLKELNAKIQERCFCDDEADEDIGNDNSVNNDSDKVIIKADTEKNLLFTSPLCPECNEKITFEGGCNICKNCGYSKCL